MMAMRRSGVKTPGREAVSPENRIEQEGAISENEEIAEGEEGKIPDDLIDEEIGEEIEEKIGEDKD